MSRKRVHVYVSGRVQGVFFRATTRDTAQERGVDGWVKNLDDGRVEAVFEGDPEAVDAMVDFCYEGSEMASVSTVEVEEEEPEGVDGFQIEY
ncbi:acylphosphatase [Haloarcula sediminis]|uniref:acylphosphatase n=1 Tax=Haloarcula sediminis TaxID=3111777 RepID=UPI002D78D772|nr:acylphosphatase [Haloarcula sp. CK38]